MYFLRISLLVLQTDALIRIRYFYVAIALLAVLILVFICTTLWIMFLKRRTIARQKQLQLQLKNWLVGVILEETDEQHPGFKVPEDIHRTLQKDFARRELLQELIRLKNSLSGQPGDNLVKLYNQLGLAALSEHRLRSHRWYRKAKGIQELAVMNQQNFAADIYPLTNYHHPVVRMEAQIALVVLQQYEGLYFFESLLYPLTEWHQVKLLQLLSNQPIPSEEVIISWLNSSNASVVQFTLMLIGEQHASVFQNEVIACLSHPQEIVRRQAITCLGEIPSVPAATALRDLYRLEPSTELQKTILTELIKTGTIDELPFLQELQQAPDAGIRLAAEKTLLHLQKQVVV